MKQHLNLYKIPGKEVRILEFYHNINLLNQDKNSSEGCITIKTIFGKDLPVTYPNKSKKISNNGSKICGRNSYPNLKKININVISSPSSSYLYCLNKSTNISLSEPKSKNCYEKQGNNKSKNTKICCNVCHPGYIQKVKKYIIVIQDYPCAEYNQIYGHLIPKIFIHCKHSQQ